MQYIYIYISVCFNIQGDETSRYNDELRVVRTGFDSRGFKILLFVIASKPTLVPSASEYLGVYQQT
jgi:hypothetical protein